MFVFFQCVASAIAEKGLRGLMDMVPGGEYACDIAESAWKKYRESRNREQIRADVLNMANSTFEQAERIAREVAAQYASRSEDGGIELELFLTGIPGAVQQSLKRTDDPTGNSVPASFGLKSGEDVLRLLPPRPPRFRPEGGLPGKPGWVLVRPLGMGGFGEVWLARNSRVDTLEGAVKFCHGLEARDRELMHESQMIARVTKHGKHPNIVPLLDANLDGDPPWLMYEYISGGDLADLIRQWQNLPPRERLEESMEALRLLARAVGHFHKLDPAVVHRDLKPANILRDGSNGRLRVTDFGIGAVAARAALVQESKGSASRGSRLLSNLRGSYTPLYASPQQREGADPDPRDDVHALGVIGYQMLTGHLTLGAGPDFAADLEELGCSASLIALLGSCVAQKVDRRPANAGAIADGLAALDGNYRRRTESESRRKETFDEPPQRPPGKTRPPTRKPESTRRPESGGAEGTLVISRQSQLKGMAGKFSISVDGVKQGGLWTGGSMELKFPAGRHRVDVRCWWMSRRFDIDIIAGETRRLEASWNALATSIRLQPISPTAKGGCAILLAVLLTAAAGAAAMVVLPLLRADIIDFGRR